VTLVLLVAVVVDVVVPVDDVLVVDGLAPLPAQEMEAYEVPMLVNAPQNGSPAWRPPGCWLTTSRPT
jgi:hypothetical protein